MAVSVKFLADVANWVSGLVKSEQAVEDNQEALEDLMKQAIELGTAAGRTTDQIADDFSKAFGVPIDRAKRAVEEVTSSTDELGEAASDAGDEMGDGIGQGADAAADHMTELGSIAKDVLAGDFSSAADTAIGMLGNLTGAIPLIGAGVTAAALIAKAGFDAMQADAEATEQRVSDMYDDMISSGERYLSADFIQKGIAEITGDQDRYNEALKLSEQLGVDVNDVVRAWAGDVEKGASLMDEQNEKRLAEIDLINESSRSLEEKSVMIDGVNTKYGELTDGVYDVIAAEDSAASRARAAASATSDFLLDTISQAGTATEEVDELGNRLYTLPSGKQIMIDAETQQATQDLSTFKGDMDNKVPTVKTSTIKVNVDSSAWDGFNPQTKFATVSTRVAWGPTTGVRPQELG